MNIISLFKKQSKIPALFRPEGAGHLVRGLHDLCLSCHLRIRGTALSQEGYHQVAKYRDLPLKTKIKMVRNCRKRRHQEKEQQHQEMSALSRISNADVKGANKLSQAESPPASPVTKDI